MDEVSGAELTSAITEPPEFLMVGMKTPRGVRIYASRVIPRGLRFGQASIDYQAHWVISTVLTHMRVVDGRDWNEALALLFTAWANEDADKARDTAIDGTPCSCWGTSVRPHTYGAPGCFSGSGRPRLEAGDYP